MELVAEMEFFLAEFNFKKAITKDYSIPGSESVALPGANFWWKASSPLVHFHRQLGWTVFLWGSARLRTQQKASQDLVYEIAIELSQGGNLPSYLANLEGDFGILVWNEEKGELFFATDPIGMVKVYYGEAQGKIIVSSHAHLVAKKLGDLTVSSEGLSILFSLKGIPAPYTIFEGVSVLKPSELLTITNYGRKSEDYWHFLDSITPFQGTFEDAQTELLRLLERSLYRIASMNQEPLGISLSSGVDSALIARLMLQAGIKIHGFTVGYDPPTRYDETQAASENARHIGLPIDVYKFSDRDIAQILDLATKSLPEPLGDATILPQLSMTLSAKEKVSSIIDGTGADNIFGGMQKFSAEGYARQYLKIPKFLRTNVVRPLLNLLPSSRKSPFTDQIRKMQKFSYGVELPEYEQKVYWSRFMTQEAIERLIAPTLNPDGCLADQILLRIRDEVPTNYDDFFRSTYVSIKGTMPTHATQKLITLQYASGTKYYMPFMTPEIVEFSMSLPTEFKFSSNEPKLILRASASRILPKECTNRKKATFSPPIGRWLMGVFEAEFMDLLKNNKWFNAGEIEKMLANQSTGWRDWQWELWLIFIFLKWMQEISK